MTYKTLMTELRCGVQAATLDDRNDAEAALIVALAGVDQAEKAMLSAVLARRDAEAIKAA